MRAAVIGIGADVLTATAVDLWRMRARLDDGRGWVVVLVGGNPRTAGDHTMTPEDLSGYVAHRAWTNHPPRREKKKSAPIMTEERQIRKWDALSTEARERIVRDAKAAAAEEMAAFQTRRGR